MIRLRTATAIALALVTAVAVGCGGSGRVDTREVERALVADFVPIEGVAVDGAECPNQVDRGAGGSFLCTVTVEGQELEVRVVQVDDDGAVRFEQQQTVFEAAQVNGQVATQVGRELGQLVTATCGDSSLIVVDPGGRVTCEVRDENGSVLTVVAELGDDGVLSVTPA